MALFGGKKSKKSKVVAEIEAILSDADTYLKNGNTEKSASEYRRAHRYLYREEKVAEDPEEFSELYTRTGHGLFETGEPDRAIECFDKATQLSPDNVDAWLSRGMVHLSNKTMLNYAVMCFNEVLKRYPNSVEALENKAEAFTLDGRDDDAKEAYIKLMEVNPSRKDEYAAKTGGEVPPPSLDTVEAIDEALRKDPKDIELWKKKAELLEEKNDAEEAVECYLRLGHLTESDDPYRKVLELDPDNVHAKEKLGIVDEPAPEMEIAEEPELIPEMTIEEPVIEEPAPEMVIEETIVEEPTPEITIEAEEPEPIIEESEPEPVIEEPTPEPEPVVEEPAFESEPEPVVEEPAFEPTPEPVIEEPEPEPVVEEAPVEDAPMSEEDLISKGDEYFENGDFENALACFDKLAELKPNDADTLHNKAAALFQMEKYDDAVGVFDKLLELDPEDVTAYLTKGASLYRSGKYDDAVNTLNNVVKRDMNNGTAWYYKACAEAKKGNNNLIFPFLTRAAGIDDDFKERARDDEAFEAVKEEQAFKDIVG